MGTVAVYVLVLGGALFYILSLRKPKTKKKPKPASSAEPDLGG